MRIAVLTSSRADYGIYLPLLKKLKEDDFFTLKIIAFGTHVSKFHGYTVENIYNDGFIVDFKVETLIAGDSETAISNSIGNTITRFSSIWETLKGDIDLIFALGDRFEMFAAVAAAVPFNIPVAHLHGGETTLGAIDNKFRHGLTQFAQFHFTSTATYAKRVSAMIGTDMGVHNVGALSLDSIAKVSLLSKEEFYTRFNIDLSIPTVLVTFHPETVALTLNKGYTDQLSEALVDLEKTYQILITMPNADTLGSIIREEFNKIANQRNRIIAVENLGTIGYFSAMQHCSFLLGNTSSGIIEAASFNKYVINIGNRQKGRLQSENVINVEPKKSKILGAVKNINNKQFNGTNLYKQENVASKITNILKDYAQ